MAHVARRRWGDNDRNFGPFTFAFDSKYPHWAVILKSSGDDDEVEFSTLRISLGPLTAIVVLPPVVRPWKRKVVAKSWSAQDVERMGRDWYYDVTPREYGISYSDGFLQIPHGIASHDSSTEQRWSCVLPWTQWRQVLHVLYGADGSPSANIAGLKWDEFAKVKDGVSRVYFTIEDFDGARIGVETFIEERVWHLGSGWFRWLGFLAPERRRRSLDMHFDKEVGREKGSWKGGLIGTGIEMLAGETHEDAFRRYCAQEHRDKSGLYRIKFIPRGD